MCPVPCLGLLGVPTPCSVPDRDVWGDDGAVGAVLLHTQAVGALGELRDVVVGVDEVNGHGGRGAAVCRVPCVIGNDLQD